MPSTVPSVLKTFSCKTEFAKPARCLDARSVLLKTIAQIVLTTTGPISSMESVFAGCLTKGPTIKESVGAAMSRDAPLAWAIIPPIAINATIPKRPSKMGNASVLLAMS